MLTSLFYLTTIYLRNSQVQCVYHSQDVPSIHLPSPHKTQNDLLGEPTQPKLHPKANNTMGQSTQLLNRLPQYVPPHYPTNAPSEQNL